MDLIQLPLGPLPVSLAVTPVPFCGRFNYLDISLRSQGCWKGTVTGCVFSLKVKLQVVFSLKNKTPGCVFSLKVTPQVCFLFKGKTVGCVFSLKVK